MVSGAIVVPRGVLGTHTDDTDYSIEVALLAAIVESSDDAIISKTLDGRIRSWNGGAMRIFGYTADEVIGQPVTIIIPPELRDEEKLFIEKLRRGERIDHFDTTRITKDGRRIPISLTISPVRDSNGTIVGASKVARDISERRRAEYLQRESEDKLGAEADALQKLNNFSTRLWQCRTVHAGLDEILDSMIDLVGADKGLVQFLDAESGVLSVAAQRGFTAAWLAGVRAVTAGDATASTRHSRRDSELSLRTSSQTRQPTRCALVRGRPDFAPSFQRRCGVSTTRYWASCRFILRVLARRLTRNCVDWSSVAGRRATLSSVVPWKRHCTRAKRRCAKPIAVRMNSLHCWPTSFAIHLRQSAMHWRRAGKRAVRPNSSAVPRRSSNVRSLT